MSEADTIIQAYVCIGDVKHGLQFKQANSMQAMVSLFRKFRRMIENGEKVEITEAVISEVVPIE